MIRQLLDLLRPQSKPAETEEQDLRADRLRRFVAKAQPRTPLTRRSGAFALGGGALPETVRVSSGGELPRPAETGLRSQRQRTLWRAVCLVAEPCIVPGDEQEDASGWAVPRSALGPIQYELSQNVDHWAGYERAYNDSQTAHERLALVRQAMDEASQFLATHTAAETGARAVGRRNLARLLRAGPYFMDTARGILGVSEDDLESLPFVSMRKRAVAGFSMDVAFKVEESLARLAVLSPETVPLVLIQASLLVRPAAHVLRATRHFSASVALTPDNPVLSWVLWRLERLADALDAGAAALALAASRGRTADLSTYEALLEDFAAELDALSETAAIDVTAAERLDIACARAAQALSHGALPACLGVLNDAITSESWRHALGHTHAVAAASLLGSAALVAARSGRSGTARESMAAARRTLATAAETVASEDLHRLESIAAALGEDTF